ncbi:MAG: TlpA family protein disulfide reductase [Actinomycetota bacterium]|nr:TlpA family protein disulfide reductase [Actinomycetota bacterium]
MTRKSVTIGRFPAAVLAMLLLACVGLAGCTSGSDAVAAQGGAFQLVTPGGKVEFDYPVADRKPLSAISGPSVIGSKRISLADYPKKVVVLNFWGAWCAPCRAETDDLVTAADDLKAKGVQFIGVNVQEKTQSDAQDFVASHQVPYPSIFDQQMRTMLSIRGYPVASIPSTIVLDRQHRVAHIWLVELKSPAPLVDVASRIAAEGP